MIVRFRNPVTGEVEEKHSKQSTETMDFFSDKKTHLFTLCEWRLLGLLQISSNIVLKYYIYTI